MNKRIAKKITDSYWDWWKSLDALGSTNYTKYSVRQLRQAFQRMVRYAGRNND